MADFSGSREESKKAWLRATVCVVSTHQWRLDVLYERLYATLGISKGFGFLEVEDIGSGQYPQYAVKWLFVLGYNGVADGNEERLQQDAEKVLAVFIGLEEKYEAAEALHEPLSWVIQTPMVDPDLGETDCARDPCCE